MNQASGQRRAILIVDLGGRMGGVESYVEGLSRMLSDRADIVCLCVLVELATRLRQAGVQVYLLPAFPPLLKPLRFVAAIAAFPVIVLRERVQVVLVNGFLEAIFLMMARLLGREAIYTRHGPFELDLYKWYTNPVRYFPRLISRVLARFASQVICVSEASAQATRVVVPAEKTLVICNWISKLPPQAARRVRDTQACNLLYVGRLERYKGLYLLLEAIRDLPNVTLTVVGDGSYRPALEKLAGGCDVRFLGFQSEMSTYYAEADIFVMPSLGPEGMPMVNIEAMAHALPCLFSDLPVHKEMTEDGQSGMLFRAGDVEDLRSKLLTLMHDSLLRARLSEAAYARVSEAYSPASARQAYLTAFGLEIP